MSDDAKRRAEHILVTTDLGDWSIIIDDIADDLDDIYADGLTEGLRLTGMGVSVDQVNTRAVAWAKQSAASLVTQIEDNTRDMLRTTVAMEIEQGWSAARVGLPPFFRAFTVTVCHKTFFSGWAFDFSTASAFYNYGGVVVKNCRCSLGVYLPDEDEEE